jgi:hypothetical protein
MEEHACMHGSANKDTKPDDDDEDDDWGRIQQQQR